MKSDRIRVSMRVAAPRALAFTVFTEEVDRWWRHGKKFRMGKASTMALEPGVGGRLIETEADGRTWVMGRITTWEPPSRLIIAWRAVNFEEADPSTEIEVTFERAIGYSGEGTLVTIEHRGWGAVRPDHPVRHGQEAPAFLQAMGFWWSDLLVSLREHTGVREERGSSD